MGSVALHAIIAGVYAFPAGKAPILFGCVLAAGRCPARQLEVHWLAKLASSVRALLLFPGADRIPLLCGDAMFNL
eukprot:3769952-Pyramimonas_sp.AAC.1